MFYLVYIFSSIFHLLYRLSERAITSLLGLFKILFSYLAAITNNQLLLEISITLPKTMHSIQKMLKNDHVEYVVCTNCCSLYDVSKPLHH